MKLTVYKLFSIIIIIGFIFSCQNETSREEKRVVIPNEKGGEVYYNDWDQYILSSKARKHFGDAMDYAKRGQNKDSWRELFLADSEEPNNTLILNALGIIESNLGNNDKSKEYLNQASKLDSTFVNTYINLATTFIRCNEYYESIKVLERGIKLADNDEKKGIINNLLAYNYYHLKKYYTANEYNEKAFYFITEGNMRKPLIKLKNDIQRAIASKEQ